MHSKIVTCRAGKPSIARALEHEFIAEAPELTWFRSPAVALACIRDSIEFLDRYEIVVWEAEGVLPSGIAIVVPECDDHVGHCLSVQWRFVSPSARGAVGRHLHRQVHRLATDLRIPVVAYTRRVGLGEYELLYRKVRSPYGQESKEDFQEDRPVHS